MSMIINYYRNYIENELEKGNNNQYIICPFGNNGMTIKRMLNECFGIKELAIVDNVLHRYNKNILCVDDLKNIQNPKALVLLNTTKETVNTALEERIKAINPSIRVHNIMELDKVYISEEQISMYREIKRKIIVKRVEGGYVRVGAECDGGYVMANDFKNITKAYSFGIANEISWDKDIANMGIDVNMYDPTIYRLPESNPRFHFNRVGIAGKDVDNSYMSMETILKMSGDYDKENMLLKMDVEGAEWDFIQHTPSYILENFNQMTFEFHGMLNTENKNIILNALDKLNQTHQAVWVHGNNFDTVGVCEENNMICPSVLEITYVNKKRISTSEEKIAFPMEWDRPNWTLRKEIRLGEW